MISIESSIAEGSPALLVFADSLRDGWADDHVEGSLRVAIAARV